MAIVPPIGKGMIAITIQIRIIQTTIPIDTAWIDSIIDISTVQIITIRIGPGLCWAIAIVFRAFGSNLVKRILKTIARIASAGRISDA